MLKKTISYTDFNGVPQKKDVYFNLTKPELIRLDVEYPGGLTSHIEKIVDSVDSKDILELFERLLKTAYGEKSEDGQSFVKSPEKRDLFVDSAMYEVLFMELLQDVEKATDFFNELIGNSAVSSPNGAEVVTK